MSTNPRLYHTERRFISLKDIETPGWILDLGGGGEGVIGQLCGQRVVSIDRSKPELSEASGGALKIVMDAKELQFLDNTFETATAFYFFMFALPENRGRIFAEIYRVMRAGGRLLLWDAVVPPFPGGEKDIYIVPITITLPNGSEIVTGYGCPWQDHEQTLVYYVSLAQEAGFTLKECQDQDEVFYLELVK